MTPEARRALIEEARRRIADQPRLNPMAKDLDDAVRMLAEKSNRIIVALAAVRANRNPLDTEDEHAPKVARAARKCNAAITDIINRAATGDMGATNNG